MKNSKIPLALQNAYGAPSDISQEIPEIPEDLLRWLEDMVPEPTITADSDPQRVQWTLAQRAFVRFLRNSFENQDK